MSEQYLDPRGLRMTLFDRPHLLVTVQYNKEGERFDTWSFLEGQEFPHKQSNALIRAPRGISSEPFCSISKCTERRRPTIFQVAYGKKWKRVDTLPFRVGNGDNCRVGWVVKYIFRVTVEPVVRCPGVCPVLAKENDPKREGDMRLVHPSGVALTDEQGLHAFVWQPFSDDKNNVSSLDDTHGNVIVMVGMQIRKCTPKMIIIAKDGDKLVISSDPKTWPAP